MRARLALAFSLAVFSAELFARVPGTGEFYAEQTFQSRQQLFSTSLRARRSFLETQTLAPVLSVGAELQNYLESVHAGPGDSYVYASPGLKASFGSLFLLTEARARLFADSNAADPAGDWRTLLVFARGYESPLSRGLLFFNEIYSEALLSSADGWNTTASGFARLGIRHRFGSTFADVFMEPFAAVDRVRHYYNNRADLKLTVRVQRETEGLTIGLQASCVANTYFTRGDFEPNPFSKRSVGCRVLGVIGGLW